MFESDEAWFAEYEALKEMPARIAAFQGKLGGSAETLLESFRLDDEISTRLSRLYGYASCKGDQDTGDNYYQDMRGKAMSTYVAIASAAAYRTSEIMAIPEDTLNLFYTVQPELTVSGRSAQLRQVADILLDNAVKYAEPGSPIQMTLRREGRNAVLWVENRSAPIPPEKLGHLFDRFYRVDESRTGGEGFGLGLAIARTIVQSHRGSIGCTSAQGVTRFTVILPLAKNEVTKRGSEA